MMSELVWLNNLIWFAVDCADDSDRVLYCNLIAVCVCEFHEEVHCSLSLCRRIAFSPYFSTSNHLLPETVKYVQGGCAMIRSHFSGVLWFLPSFVVNHGHP